MSGECFSVGGGHYARVGLEVTEGLVDRDATIETIAAGAAAILDSPATPITDDGVRQHAPDVRRLQSGLGRAGAG